MHCSGGSLIGLYGLEANGMRTHYDNLHIKETASLEVIKAAYKALAQKWHPDKNPDQREKAERYFKIITRALEVLSDPAVRAKYDAWLAEQRSTEQPPEAEQAEDQPQTNHAAETAEAWGDGKRSREQGFYEKDCPYSGELAEAWLKGFGSAEPGPNHGAWSWIGRLWRGEEGLAKTFWLYGVVGTSLVFVAGILMSGAIVKDASDIAGIIRFAQNFYISYFVFISICTFRSLRRALITTGDNQARPTPGSQPSQGATAQAPLMYKLINGELQARYVIIFGSVLPVIALAVLFRGLEKPASEDLAVRIYMLCTPLLLSCAYIVWSASRLGSGPRKRAMIGATALWAAVIVLIAISL